MNDEKQPKQKLGFDKNKKTLAKNYMKQSFIDSRPRIML